MSEGRKYLIAWDLATHIQKGDIPSLITLLQSPFCEPGLKSPVDNQVPCELDRSSMLGRLLLGCCVEAWERNGLLSFCALLERGANIDARGGDGGFAEWIIVEGKREHEPFQVEVDRARDAKWAKVRYEMPWELKNQIYDLCGTVEADRRVSEGKRPRAEDLFASASSADQKSASSKLSNDALSGSSRPAKVPRLSGPDSSRRNTSTLASPSLSTSRLPSTSNPSPPLLTHIKTRNSPPLPSPLSASTSTPISSSPVILRVLSLPHFITLPLLGHWLANAPDCFSSVSSLDTLTPLTLWRYSSPVRPAPPPTHISLRGVSVEVGGEPGMEEEGIGLLKKRPYALCTYETQEMAETAKQVYSGSYVVPQLQIDDIAVAARVKTDGRAGEGRPSI